MFNGKYENFMCSKGIAVKTSRYVKKIWTAKKAQLRWKYGKYNFHENVNVPVFFLQLHAIYEKHGLFFSINVTFSHILKLNLLKSGFLDDSQIQSLSKIVFLNFSVEKPLKLLP
jgi:hypothetical protein